MRILLVYPIFPKTFWSYEKILELVDRKVLLPPLGLVTVAAILPQEWEFKLVDRNIRPATEADWPGLWRIVEPVLAAWRAGDVPLLEYAAGSTGPDDSLLSVPFAGDDGKGA